MIGWLSCNYKRGIAYGWISVMVGCNSRLRLRLGLGLGTWTWTLSEESMCDTILFGNFLHI